ncbi:MAG: glycerol-3-phosphate 1-O-acyltransferase [Deltaproteobacteria bacterium]|nr:glycerol-3-phosphate 1-O-acyltransferase [Deltaproteobacteria bacterium]
MTVILWLILSYLIGAVPFGLIIARTLCHVDPRTTGSGNIGATNVARICGLRYGVATLLLDISKGFFPVLVATAMSESHTFVTLTGLAVLIGHMKSFFLHGKGGKGVATTIGIFLALAPISTLLAVACGLGVIYYSGYVSLGSLCLTGLLPLFLLVSLNLGYLPLALIIFALVFWAHGENIERLKSGHENTWRKTQAVEPD